MKTLATLMMGLVAVSAVVMAHPQAYVNVVGDELVDCDILGDGGTLNQGGACYEAGHVAAAADGSAAVTIADNLLSPTSGYYDQDLDGDGTGDGVFAAGFCGTHALQSGVNWDESGAILVWADGAVFGNPVLSVCGTLSSTVQGVVDHSV